MNNQFKKAVVLFSVLVSLGAISLPAFADAMLSTGGYARQL